MKPTSILLFCIPLAASKPVPATVTPRTIYSYMPSSQCVVCIAVCLAGYDIPNFTWASPVDFRNAGSFAVCTGSCVLQKKCADAYNVPIPGLDQPYRMPNEGGKMWIWMKNNGFVPGIGQDSPDLAAMWMPGNPGFPGGAGTGSPV